MKLLLNFMILASLNVAALLLENCSEVVVVQSSEGTTINQLKDFTDTSIFTSNSEIWVCSREIFILSSVIYVENVSNITIHGYKNLIIRCPSNNEAGFRFSNIDMLTISDITIDNCAAASTFDSTPEHNIIASINIEHSSDVCISNINVINGPGSGLAMFDIDGSIEITESRFEGNGHNSKRSGGNGLYLEVSAESKLRSSPLVYSFKCCKFINNSANTEKDKNITGFSRFDKGGGICIYVRSHDGVKIIIENTTISGNEALAYGGGAYMTFNNDARNSQFIVRRSNYTDNSAAYGGGHYSGYLHFRSKNQTPLNCSHVFISNQFVDNYANYGGGVSVFSTRARIINQIGNVSFENCTWKENSAQFGSAIAILPNAWNLHTEGYLPTVYFSNSEIYSNKVIDNFDGKNSFIKQYTKGSGALFCTNHILKFCGNNNFQKNSGSALYMGSCTASFSQYSKTSFSSNSGYHGGGIYLTDSVMYLSEDTLMIFDNNTASDGGGAIYHTSDNFHTYNYSRTCFFTYLGNISDPAQRNISIQFTNNSAGTRTGHSIYTFSLYPCYKALFSPINITTKLFDYLGNITYNPPDDNIATAASHVSTASLATGSILVLPGQKIELLYENRDDLNQTAKSVYSVTEKNFNNSMIKVDEAYRYISSNEVLLYGKSGDRAELRLSSYESRQRSLIINVTMLPCPPGYILNVTLLQCICAFGTNTPYIGIEHCNYKNWQAYRRCGSWIGYGENENEDYLFTGDCPIGFCSHNNILLPNTSNRDNLNRNICSSRLGTLCGLCDTNHSVYYHSLNFICRPDKNCEIGWLFYILSELVPVTAIFLIIIIFNVTFTSGKINGFIFFAQVVVMLQVTADNYIYLPNGTKALNRILHFLYFIFNLNIFMPDELSFCLFKGASALDAVIFGYVTLVYSFVLVIVIILLMNKLNLRYCHKTLGKCIGPQWQTLQGSIIHGLTAFLVLCYAQCSKTSIMLITYAHIYGKGGKIQDTVVFYNGNIPWFSIAHLPYALPAIVMMLVLVLPPPIILIIYPLHYKVLAALNLSESKYITALLHPLEKMKPLIDSFQGSFKDEYRLFSGLYFVYRFVILTTVATSRLPEMYYIVLGILLLIILLQAVCQPYKERAHNITDTLLFINLTVINGITMYNFSSNSQHIKFHHTVTITLGYIQSMLMGLPIIVAILCFIKKLVSSMKTKKCKRKDSNDEEERFPARMQFDMDSYPVYQHFH